MFTNFLLQNRSKPMVRILEKYGTDNKSNPDLANSHPNPTEENRFFFLKKKNFKNQVKSSVATKKLESRSQF